MTVNLAKRLEEATRSLGVDMLVTDQVANKLPMGHGHQIRRLGEASLKGFSEPVGIIEVCDHEPPESGISRAKLNRSSGRGLSFSRLAALKLLY